jgi:hypothetical protein
MQRHGDSLAMLPRSILLLALLAGCAGHPAPTPPPEARRPHDRRAMEYWYANMARHGYSPDEMFAAAGLSDVEIERLSRRIAPPRPSGGRLLVLPYPGGRHPRIGFLDGAIDPQRETKASIFSPWPGGGYIVVDVPEAIFTNLGLTYLAHTHIPTIWTQRGVMLQRLEWTPSDNGSLVLERTLPNRIRFGARLAPEADHVLMELWIHNGTAEPLTDIRAQVCTMFRGLPGFDQQSGQAVTSRPPFVIRKANDADRWVITAWQPLHRTWNNPPVPCIHSDPRIEDIPPRQTRRAFGIIAFHQGNDLPSRLRQLEEHIRR